MAAAIPLVSRLDPRAIDPLIGGLLLVFLGWAALSLIWTPDRLTGANDLFQIVILAAVALAVANAEDVSPLMIGATVGLAVSSVLAVAQFWGWSPIEQATPPAGLFLNRDMLAEFAAPLLVWVIADRRYWFAVIPAIPLLICQSRVSLLAAAAGLLVVLPLRVSLGVGLAACLGMGLLGTLPFNPAKIISASARWDIWTGALSDLRLVGHGLGSFMATYPQWEYAHSDLLQTVYELGIGAILLVALAIVVSWQTNGVAARGALLAMGIEVLVAFPLHLPATGFLAMALVGNAGRARYRLRLHAAVGRGFVRERV